MARDLGLPVGELGTRLSWAELLHWIALYQIEANQALPPHLRTVRPRTSEDTVRILDQVFASACSPTPDRPEGAPPWQPRASPA